MLVGENAPHRQQRSYTIGNMYASALAYEANEVRKVVPQVVEDVLNQHKKPGFSIMSAPFHSKGRNPAPDLHCFSGRRSLGFPAQVANPFFEEVRRWLLSVGCHGTKQRSRTTATPLHRLRISYSSLS